MRRLLATVAMIVPVMAAPAVTWADVDLSAIVDDHIMTGYAGLARDSAALASAAQAECSVASAPLLAAYNSAFDAWVRVSHLRFGPSEADNRAFALAFWPDPRSSGSKTLAKLLAEPASSEMSVAEFQSVSVAARGFYALELMLYDTHLSTAGTPEPHCALVRLITSDIAQTTQSLLEAWQAGYGDAMRNPAADGLFRTRQEAVRQLFTALSTGLEFTSTKRLGRPLGTFDKPRPKRAEAWRSERSLRHVTLSLEAARDLAALLSADQAVLSGFDRALAQAARLEDPAFAGVSEPVSRLRVESLQSRVEEIREAVALELAPQLGVAAGFNSLDGD